MMYKVGDTFVIDDVPYTIICLTKIPKPIESPMSTTTYGSLGWGMVYESYTYEYGWKLMDTLGLKSTLYKSEQELIAIEKANCKLAQLL